MKRTTTHRPKPWADLSRQTQKVKTKAVFDKVGQLAEELDINLIDLIKFFGDWAASQQGKLKLAHQFRTVDEDFEASVPEVPAVTLQTTLNLSVNQYMEIRLFCLGYGLTFPSYDAVCHAKEVLATLRKRKAMSPRPGSPSSP